MPQAQAAAAENDEQSTSTRRPERTSKQGGVEVSVWKNHGEKSGMYNTTIRNSYKVDKSDEWKETTSFSPTYLAVLAQLSSQAFRVIGKLKSPGPGR